MRCAVDNLLCYGKAEYVLPIVFCTYRAGQTYVFPVPALRDHNLYWNPDTGILIPGIYVAVFAKSNLLDAEIDRNIFS